MDDPEVDAEVLLWRRFWLASELSATAGPGFAERINDTPPPSDLPRLATYAGPAHPLARADDALWRTSAARCSTRAFGPARLSARSMGALFTAFDGRAWPSAGALYPVEVFALLFNVDHPLNGRVVHYEPDTHELTDIASAPSWDALREPLGGQVLVGTPQVVVVFALDCAAMEAKYGTRGGRFALIEVGHAAHALALRLTSSKMVGCELGGTYDRHVKALLGLEATPLLVALGYACGLPA